MVRLRDIKLDPELVREARQQEIYRRRRKRKRATPLQFAAIRVRELERIFHYRYGEALPNDDAGRADAKIVAHHLAHLSNPGPRIRRWVGAWCPWISALELEAIAKDPFPDTFRYKADRLAWMLRLTKNERAELKITTIGAIDFTAAERARQRKQRDKAAKRKKRRAAGFLTRRQYLAKIVVGKPWEAADISRATYYRKRRSLMP